MGSIFHEAYHMGLTYVELPDLSLSALQERFTIPSELEQLYKRYEQRFQIGEMLLNYSNTECIIWVWEIEGQIVITVGELKYWTVALLNFHLPSNCKIFLPANLPYLIIYIQNMIQLFVFFQSAVDLIFQLLIYFSSFFKIYDTKYS